jgi:hypothetical protein
MGMGFLVSLGAGRELGLVEGEVLDVDRQVLFSVVNRLR